MTSNAPSNCCNAIFNWELLLHTKWIFFSKENQIENRIIPVGFDARKGAAAIFSFPPLKKIQFAIDKSDCFVPIASGFKIYGVCMCVRRKYASLFLSSTFLKEKQIERCFGQCSVH